MKVIKQSQLPTKLPIMPSITAALALSYWKAPGWVWGAVGLLFLFFWIGAIAAICKQDQTEVSFKEEQK